MFKPWFEKREPIYTYVGDKTRPLYKPELRKNGEIELVEDGYEDIYSQIQSFKDSVDINVIVSRYAHGDAYALQQRQGVYGDFIQVPSSYMDVLNQAIELKRIYSENENLRNSFKSLDDFVENFGKVDISPTIPEIDNSSEVGEEEK